MRGAAPVDKATRYIFQIDPQATAITHSSSLSMSSLSSSSSNTHQSNTKKKRAEKRKRKAENLNYTQVIIELCRHHHLIITLVTLVTLISVIESMCMR